MHSKDTDTKLKIYFLLGLDNYYSTLKVLTGENELF